MATCTPDALAAAARCFCGDALDQQRIQILLLCAWANGGEGPVNLNSVTWEPDNLMVDYSIGGGVITATMAQFNLVDPTLVISFTIENSGLDSIINLDELVNLEELRLSGNDLATLPALPETLTVLDISNNDLTAIPWGAWEAMPVLESLFFANNLLSVIIIEWPTTLAILDLSNNDIETASWSTGGVGTVAVTNVNITGSGMIQEDVDELAVWVASSTENNGTLSMTGNSAPGDPAIAALNTLVANGWTLAFEQMTMTAIGDLAANASGPNAIDTSWSWTGNTEAIDHFEVRWGIVSGVYTDNDTVAPNEVTYQITGLLPETEYFVNIRPVSSGNIFYAAGNGPNSNEASATTGAP